MEEYKINYKTLILLSIGAILVLFGAVILLTRPAVIPLFDLSEKGSIGDTISGITTPIISFVGAILVYLSFQAQIEANRIQRTALKEEAKANKQQQNFNSLLDIFKQLKEDYNYLEYTLDRIIPKVPSKVPPIVPPKVPHKGRAALNVFINDIKKGVYTQDPNFFKDLLVRDFSFIISVMILLINKIGSCELDQEDKKLLLELIVNYYNMKMRTQVSDLIKLLEPIEKMHPFRNSLIQLKSKITETSKILRKE